MGFAADLPFRFAPSENIHINRYGTHTSQICHQILVVGTVTAIGPMTGGATINGNFAPLRAFGSASAGA